MPSIDLYPAAGPSSEIKDVLPNPLPTLIQTPSGLAILEIQGTIHAPFPAHHDGQSHNDEQQTPIGKLDFPLYKADSDPNDLKWMKKVYLYVGKHQRLTGEVKKLAKPLVVIAKRDRPIFANHTSTEGEEYTEKEEDLEILEVIKHKILFGGRPEPVGDES